MAFANTVTGVPGSATYSQLFGLFPTTQYDINNNQGYYVGSHETVTDIFFRFSILRSIVNNTSAYYVYNILDSDTPEILAEQVYNDKGAGWIILYANRIFDPQFDWPLNYDAFQKMIIDRYGSVEYAQTTTHHYERVITRTNSFSGTTSITNFVVDEFNSFNDVNTYEIDGKTVVVTVSDKIVNIFDYEVKKNDDKRLIKIIKNEYYLQIMNEFKNLTKKQPKYMLGFV